MIHACTITDITHPRDPCPEHLDRYSPRRIGSQLAASCLGLAVAGCLQSLSILILGILVVSLVFRLGLSISWLGPLFRLSWPSPSTSRLFSGSRFPLEILSNIGFHISSLSVSRLPGRSWLPGTRVGKLEVRRALAIAEVLRSFVAGGTRLCRLGDDVWMMYTRYATEAEGLMRHRVNV